MYANKKLLSTLWPLFKDGFQLPKGYRINLLHLQWSPDRLLTVTKEYLKLSNLLMLIKKNFFQLYDRFWQMGFNCLMAAEPLWVNSSFLPLSSQKFLVLIWSTLKMWKAESTLEPSSCFEHKTLGLGIQCLNH